MNIHSRTIVYTLLLGIGTFSLMVALHPGGPPPNAPYWFVPTLATLAAGVAVGIYIESRSPNIGSVARFGDSRVLRFARSVAGVSMEPCGCVHLDTHDTRPSVERKDREHVWLREHDGAKVKYTDGERQFVRCENCGERYHRTRQNPHSSVKHEFWNDDPEPWPDDEKEIVDTELIDA